MRLAEQRCEAWLFARERLVDLAFLRRRGLRETARAIERLRFHRRAERRRAHREIVERAELLLQSAQRTRALAGFFQLALERLIATR